MENVFKIDDDDRRLWEIVSPTGYDVKAGIADRHEAVEIYARRVGPAEKPMRALVRKFAADPDDLVAEAAATGFEWMIEQMDGGTPPFRIDARHFMSLPSWVMCVRRFAPRNRREIKARRRFAAQSETNIFGLIEKGVREGRIPTPDQSEKIYAYVEEMLLCLPAMGLNRELFAVEAYYGLPKDIRFDPPGLVSRCERARLDKSLQTDVILRGESGAFDPEANSLRLRDIGHLLDLGEKQVSRLIHRGTSELAKL